MELLTTRCGARLAPRPAGSLAPYPARIQRRLCKRLVQTTEVDKLTPVTDDSDASRLVDDVLKSVEGKDGGLSMKKEEISRVDGLIEQLEEIGAQQNPRPLDNPLVFGNYTVDYTSAGKSVEYGENTGQPSGGRFRSNIGRKIFQTTGLYQSVLSPDLVINKVGFKLFGLLPGYVGLRGKLEKYGEKDDTVRVTFEPPIISFGGQLNIRLGRPSRVQLTTTYLDERVRLGKGSRGSLFVFKRGGEADRAGMAEVGVEGTTPQGVAMLAGFFAVLVLGGAALWATSSVVLKVLALPLWLVALMAGLTLRNGGLIMSRGDGADGMGPVTA